MCLPPFGKIDQRANAAQVIDILIEEGCAGSHLLDIADRVPPETFTTQAGPAAAIPCFFRHATDSYQIGKPAVQSKQLVRGFLIVGATAAPQ